jgi:TetR/AcrR family transcriptional regulator
MASTPLRKKAVAKKGVKRVKAAKTGGMKELEGLSTRDIILKISTRLFAKEGYDRVTMRDISSEVGVTMPTIYHHFKDKENLYRQVEQESYGAMKVRLLRALEDESNPEQRLRAFTREFYDLFVEDPIFLSLAIRNMLDPDERHHKFLVGVAMQDVYDAFSKLLNELRPGAGDKLGPIIILSGILGFVTMAPAKRHIDSYVFSGKAHSKKERDAFIDYTVGAVVRV